MRKLLFALGLLMGALSAICQQTVTKTSDWNLVFENEQVKLFSKYTNCEIPQEGLYAEYILLKAENKTDSPVQLSWFNDMYYPSGCTNCDHQRRDTKRTLILQAKEVKEGDCQPGLNIGLKVFSRWLRAENHRTLEKLIISEISSSSVN